jgi:hypothetical protein
MGQKAKPIGRKDCMDAMCHMCHNFNVDGRYDCEQAMCPLFTFSPYAKGDPVIPWTKIAAKSAIGLVPRAKVEPAEYIEAALRAAAWKYGSAASLPDVIRGQINTARGELGAPQETTEAVTLADTGDGEGSGDLDW